MSGRGIISAEVGITLSAMRGHADTRVHSRHCDTAGTKTYGVDAAFMSPGKR